MTNIPKKLTFPTGLYEYLVRKANLAVKTPFLKIKYPAFILEFQTNLRRGNPKTVDWLFEELSKRLVSITRKYNLEIDQDSRKKDIKIDYFKEDIQSKISISGYEYIPLKSFGNMLSIIVWSFIVYKTGKKPSEDEEANQILKIYLEDFEGFKVYWNRYPRKKITMNHNYKCHICGKEAIVLNKWRYTHKANVEDVYTPVCEIHKDHLI